MSTLTVLKSDDIAEKLRQAGIITDLQTARRVIIDIEAGDVVRVYVELYGTREMLDLILPEVGRAEIKVLPVKEAA